MAIKINSRVLLHYYLIQTKKHIIFYY